jgi:hypothetical protein
MGATLPKGHLFLSTMHSPRLAGKTETFLRYGATPRLEVGFGYLWRQNVVRPLASYTLLPERRYRPALTGGLFFDALGGGREAVFVTTSKDLRLPLRVPVSVYLGGAQVTNEGSPRLLAGGRVAVIRGLNASLQYDGKRTHLGLSGLVGRVGGRPVYLGLILTGGSALGPLGAMDFDLTR